VDVVETFLTAGTYLPVDQLKGTVNTFPPGLNIASGAAEVFMVFMGLSVGFGVLFFGYNNSSMTFLFTLVSLVLGWYVFVVNAIARPIFNFKKDQHPPLEPLGGWDSQYRADVTFYMGYLVSSMCTCAISIGLHFYSVLNLYRTQEGLIDRTRLVLYRARLIYYGCLVLVLGLGIITLTGWVRKQEGAGRLARTVIYPPTFITYPNVGILSGLCMLVYGIIALQTAVMPNKNMVAFTVIAGVLLWVWMVGFHVMCQIAQASRNALGQVQFNGQGIVIAYLMTSVCFAPAWFAQDLGNALSKREDAYDVKTSI